MDLNNSFSDGLKVLLVDDDKEDFIIMKHLFSRIKDVHILLDWVASSDEAIRAIEGKVHDLYLVDYRIDAKTGIDILQAVGARERLEPFILLTGVQDQKIERKSVQYAAADFLVKKNLTTDILAKAVFYALGRKEQENQKIEQLKELNRTKDEFISIASHQLRTPATTVKQYLAMVIDGIVGELTEKQKKLLTKAYESNERQLKIVNDLLKVAQIDAGKLQLFTEEVNVGEYLQEIYDDFNSIFTHDNKILQYTPKNNIIATFDKDAIRMVVDNLLENAKKYSEPETATSIELEQDDTSITISVRDHGVGVADPERLFEKFSRIDNKLSMEVGGTGLGLYWAASICELHGGKLVYSPNTPLGSIFTIQLPSSVIKITKNIL